MATLAIIFSLIALAAALGKYVEQFFKNPERDARWRSRLIAFYTVLENNTPALSKDDLMGHFAYAALAVFGMVMLVVRAYIDSLEASVYRFLFSSRWYHNLLDLSEWLYSYVKWPYFVVLGVIFVGSLLICAYGLARMLVLHMLGTATDPKNSPLTFTVITAGIAAALGKLSLDLAKAITS